MIILNQSTYDALSKLSSIEIEALYSIYLYRCLTYKQLHKIHFLKEYESVSIFEDTILKKWIKLGLVKKVYFRHNNYVLFLTTRGVDILRIEYDFPVNILNDNKQVIHRGYFRANELEMHPRLINHQVYLNQFVLDFKRYSIISDKNYNTNLYNKLKYTDEKHLSSYTGIRPDGKISLMDIDFFIEMDMSTESKTQLEEKWENYRRYLSSSSFQNKPIENKIIVLFIIENSKDLEKRKDLVKLTASQILLDQIDSQFFDIYIGSSKELLTTIFNDILPSIEGRSVNQNNLLSIFSKEDFLVSHGYNIKQWFDNIEYNYYIRKINKDGSLKLENGRPIEFLVDDYRTKPMSILNRIDYHMKNNALFKTFYNRDIPLLIIADSIEKLYSDLELIDFDFDRNHLVYFCIINEMENKTIDKCLFQLDNFGNIYKFKDYSLKTKMFYSNIK